MSGVSWAADGLGGAGATQFHGAFCADVCVVSEGKRAQEATTAVIDLLSGSRWPGPLLENSSHLNLRLGRRDRGLSADAEGERVG